MPTQKDIERFKSKMGKLLVSGCIEWQASCNPKTGYGMAWVDNQPISAHRASYIIFKGEPIYGQIVRHTCDNRKCVNPDHLILGTYKQNNDDRWLRGKNNKGSNHGRSILTEEEVKEIRNDPYLSRKELAVKYNTSYSNIVRIINGSSWKHVR